MKQFYLLSTLMLLALMLPQNVKAQVSVWDGTYAPWTNGTGTETDPFLIENAKQLAYLAFRVNNGLDAAGGHVSNHNLHYKLMVNVNLNGSENFQWTPIGYSNSNTDYYCFGGHFDGNNHTVSGLYINCSANRVGFFGYTDGAEIKNLSVSGNLVSTTGTYAGGIVGIANTTIVKSCANNCNVSCSSNYSFAGGLVGAGSTTITNSHNVGAVSSNSNNSRIGGIVGETSGITTINNCYNKGDISTAYSCYSGGIIGQINASTSVNNCYNRGSLSNSYALGGIVGNISNYSTINNCYSTGVISSTSSYSGGIVGSGSSSVYNCYYLDNCGGNNTYGGSPISSAAMKTADFVNILNNGSCAFEQDWSPQSNSGYPLLTMISLDTKTLGAVNVTQTHSTLKGTISIENDIVISTGFMYKTTNDTSYTFVTCNNATDSLLYTLSGLVPSTSYSYKTYLETVGCDTTFGTDKSFTTLAVSVNTNNPTSVTQTHTTISGNLSMGDATITNQGFEYKQYGEDWVQVTTPYNNNISYTLSNLIPNTQYSYRAFATADECGTIYGQTRTFTTLSISSYTDNATNVTQTHASLNGYFTIGDADIAEQGFEYMKTTDTAFQTVSASGNGNIAETVTGLMPGTQYLYRAYCTAIGCATVYGTTKYFTTQNVSVTTNTASDLTASSATMNGTMNMGDATVTSKGFEYRAVGDTSYITLNATMGTNNFSAPLYNLTANTQYEYRAFVIIAENPTPYYGFTQTFEVSLLNADTILIYDADMLLWVSQRCNSGITFEGKYIKLMNNIVLPANQPNNMTSIGIYPNYPFKGTFDGNGMTITNLYIDQPNTPYQGFFGYTQNANLYQVGLVNITASGRNYTGGMVAYAENTYMRECYVNGGSLFALSYCGGLVGFQQMGTNSIISGCYSTCTVSGNNYVGGLVGYSNYSTVRNSYVAASVSGQGAAIGAIIGGANEVLMYNCYFSSAITGQTSAIGENNLRTNEGMTDEAMRAPSFVNILNQGLVVPVWKADYAVPINNGFPILIWQYSDVVACEAPVNPVGILSGDSATLSWTGGDNADLFIVEYGISGSPAITQNTPNHQLVLHNLQNGSYYWRVKTVCAFGESNFVNGTPIAVIPDSHDTIIINVHDTTYIDVPYPVHDTTFVDVYVPVHDTTYVDVPYYLHDTTFVNVHDTTFINVPYAVHDTTYITIYDTTAGLVFHDTLYVDVPYPVYDTTYIDVYVTIHDTTYVDVPYPVHDTTYVDVPYPVHDTTNITLSDTIFITLYDTTYLTVHDTVTVTEQLTWHSLQVYSESINKGVAAGSGQFPEGTNVEIAAIPIEGYRFLQWDDGYTWNPRTITLNDNLTLTAMFTTVGVTDLELPTWYVYPEKGAFVVKGVGSHQVSVYDAVGKLLHRYSDAPEILRYSVPAAGSYYIQVDNGAAKKVTVVR